MFTQKLKDIKYNIFFIYNRRISKIKLFKLGYINFYIKQTPVVKSLICAIKFKNRALFLDYNKHKKVLFEILSANPTGHLHTGHGRSSLVADCISRLYKHMGYNVNKEYYINDVGRQISTLAHSVYYKYSHIVTRKYKKKKKCRHFYKHKNFEHNFKFLVYNQAVLYNYKNQLIVKFVSTAPVKNLLFILNTLNTANIKINQLFSEKVLYHNLYIATILKFYKSRNKMYYKESEKSIVKSRAGSKANIYEYMKKGGFFLKTKLVGDAKDRIILRHNNSPVYLLSDIAYHKNKICRGYFKIINIFGADHIDHTKKLYYCLNMLNYDCHNVMDNILVQMVSFSKDSKHVKLSKRKNIKFLLKNFIKKFDKHYLRSMFISRSFSSHLKISIPKPKQKNLNTISQIKKLKMFKKLIKYSVTYTYIKKHISSFYLIDNNKENILIKLIYFFYYLLEICFLQQKTNLLVFYTNQLTTKLNSYISYCNSFQKTINFFSLSYICRLHVIYVVNRVIEYGMLVSGII